MITVTIQINGSTLYHRSAVRLPPFSEDGKNIYAVDDGSTITHKHDDGTVKLAIAMLKSIKEPGADE
ncbi:hypothetical protein MASR1M8_16290 [Thermomonas brevis]